MVPPVGIALVAKTPRQFRAQSQVGVHLAQEQGAGIGGEGAAGEIGLHAAGAQVIKEQRLIDSTHTVSLG